jgi:hypothetical protein
MLGLLPILLPLLGDAITSLFGGSDKPAGQVAATVANATVSVASQVIGIPVTDEASARQAADALQADPEKLAAFRQAVGEQVLRALSLDNDDRASARSQTVELAKTGSNIAWGAPAVSLVVLVTFGVVLYRVLSAPAGQADPNASLMLGALTTMATAVVSYWVGSSAGSAVKDKLLRGR